MHEGAINDGIDDLERARRKFYEESSAESRASLLVGLGDALRIAKREDEAVNVYSEALRQPAHMNNFSAIQVAKQRLFDKRDPVRTNSRIYLP